MTNSVLQTWETPGSHFACYLFIYSLIYRSLNKAVSISEYSTGW